MPSRRPDPNAHLRRVAALALAAASRVLPPYSAPCSPKNFTHPQLAACLVLRVFLRLDYRGLCARLAADEALRSALGLKAVPDHSTLVRFAARALAPETLEALVREACRGGSPPSRGGEKGGGGEKAVVALDSTGFDARCASAYYMARSGLLGRRYVKLMVAVEVGSLAVRAAVAGWGPSVDIAQAGAALRALSRSPGRPVGLVLGDMGFDSEAFHEDCSRLLGARSYAPVRPFPRRADGTCSGPRRESCRRVPPSDYGYGKRWAVETVFSGIKRRFGASAEGRGDAARLRGAMLKAIAWTLHRRHPSQSFHHSSWKPDLRRGLAFRVSSCRGRRGRRGVHSWFRR